MIVLRLLALDSVLVHFSEKISDHCIVNY